MTSASRRAASAAVLGLRRELAAGMRQIAVLDLDERSVEVVAGHDSVWAIIRRGKPGDGGIALRIAHCWGGCSSVRRQRKPAGALLALTVDSAVGVQHVTLRSDARGLTTLRVTTVLTPSEPLLIPFFPRDVYPLGPGDDPLLAV